MKVDFSKTLHRPEFDLDACGVGFVARLTGQAGHDMVQMALQAVGAMKHRAGINADGRSGEGAGVLTQIPHRLLAAEIPNLPPPGDYALGVFFLPGLKTGETAIHLVDTVLETLERSNVQTFKRSTIWRHVPLNLQALGPTARPTCPVIRQLILPRPEHIAAGSDFERFLYAVRKQIETAARQANLDDLYVASFSASTVVYKGMLLSSHLADFYLDLANPLYETALALLYTRYSANTAANWQRTQPFRLAAHNGQLTTIQGNVNWLRGRESTLAAPGWPNSLNDLQPIIDPSGNDSAMLDNMLELLFHAGRDLHHAIAMLLPEAWENLSGLRPDRRAFYRYHAALMEPWDGPATVVFSDGQRVGAASDRNGLRPLRYIVTNNNLVIATSEAGGANIDESSVVIKGKLGPGQMILVDLERQQFLANESLKNELAHRQPYQEWVQGLKPLPTETRPAYFSLEPVSQRPQPPKINSTPQWLARLQAVFGYTPQEIAFIIHPMADEGQEPTGPIGHASPPTLLSRQPHPLFYYFKQRVAQITHPPIDPVHETLVMSLTSRLGSRLNLLDETPKHAHLIELASPVLGDADLTALKGLGDPRFQTRTIPMRYPIAQQTEGLHRALQGLCKMAEDAIDQGKTILILSDLGVNEDYAPIPSLLAVGAVHHHLVKQGKRMRVSLVVESGEVRQVHHLACLMGYGANAVNPYLTLATVENLVASGQIKLPVTIARQNLIRAMEAGLLKTMSKMGLSTVDSYCGAQSFETIGLEQALVDEYFTGTVSRPGGIGLAEIAAKVAAWHRAGFVTEYTAAKEIVDPAGQHPAIDLRHGLDFIPETGQLPLNILEVEPLEAIMSRFSMTAISLNAEIIALQPSASNDAPISALPHYDIYSLENLTQLIYDLKQVNPKTGVAVKLVPQTGVNAIAAAVVNSGVDRVYILGDAGVVPLSSLKNVGLPWEISLAEIQQTLLANGLRRRVRIRVSGGLQTGRDVVMAAILGADEYSFDAVALAASGRQPIHASANNTYLASIPAQQSHLRAKFAGMPEGVTVYLRFLAEEVRQILAQLGFRCLEDIIGQTELLRQIATGDSAIDRLDLSLLLAKPASPYSSLRPASGSTLQHSNLLTRPEVDDLNKLLLEQASPALITGEPVQLTLPISHTDRTIGASLAGEIAKRYGDRGLPDNTLNFTFLGSAGHSFGAFLVPGLNLTLIGEANGYVGQGMAGGQIVVRPSLKLHLTAGDPIIMGNTALYGATGGSLFVAGQAGERFAGRNNGAIAVIEGLGDHGCEYMNDGVVVVLGRTGYNFGAAMSGGLAFVLDEGHHLTHRLNPDRVQLVRITKEHDAALLKHLIIRHVRLTGSPRGQAILDNWLERLGLFWKVAPKGTVGSSAIQTAERLPDLSGLVA